MQERGRQGPGSAAAMRRAARGAVGPWWDSLRGAGERAGKPAGAIRSK